MSFISYARDLEDVILYRALKHIEGGFYIDVGAGPPIGGSVTRAFYDRGWRGINIEPVTESFKLLQQHRPDDVDLNLAVGNHKGDTIVYEVVDNVLLSTTIKSHADRHAEAGYKIRTHRISCTTLDSICTEHNVGVVHILKIDVEGAEKAVLEGFGFAAVRPWVVVIESAKPNTMVDVSREWESLILDRNYRFVYSDGVNRFYLAAEHLELQPYLCYPPNAFDDYIIYPHWLALHELSEERARVVRTLARIHSLESHIHSLESHVHSLEFQIHLIHQSIPMQLVRRYQRIVDRLLRPSTRRRRPYDLALMGIRVILNEGWRSFWHKLRQRYRQKRDG